MAATYYAVHEYVRGTNCRMLFSVETFSETVEEFKPWDFNENNTNALSLGLIDGYASKC